MLNYNYATDTLYPRARSRGRWSQIWSRLTRRPRRLLSLAEIAATYHISARYDAGIQTIPISQIRGSGGRRDEFDHNFNLLRHHNRERWLSIAKARQRGKVFPPVKLIQVGGIYFVRDGHHRISVAQAMGQKEIEARVTVWHMTGPFLS